MKKAEHFFTDEEKEKIRRAVARAEGRSSGEIVPMVIDRSGHYLQFALTGAILFTFLIAVIAAAVWPRITASQLLLGELFTFWLFFQLIQRTGRLWSWLIPDPLMDKVVARRAEEAFYEHRLHETRDKTGLLILLSLLERRVHLLADKGIHEKVPPQTWENLAGQISAGMKEGHSCQAFCDAIEACGNLLAQYFPKRTDDTDELSNRLRVGE